MDLGALKTKFLPKFVSIGEYRFYKFLLFYALNKLVYINQNNLKNTSPEEELLDISDQFMILYRREGDLNYLNLSKIFRKAGHKIYRVMLKRNMINKNVRFLNLVNK